MIKLDVLDNKCPGCGAKITFNPKIQKWDCEYCDSKFSLEEMQQYNNASSAKANKKKKINKDKKLEKMDVYSCKNCGAEIMADETVTATFCVYCGSTAILKDKIEDGIAPTLIIPFKKVREDAITAFTNLTKRKILTPKEFKDIKNIEKVAGVYIPFWTYDLLADGNMTFLSTDTRMWSDYNYNYTETSRYNVNMYGKLEYSKVLADASTRFADDLMDSLEPFDLSDLIEYNHAYLSGFLAEKYDVSEDDGFARATERTMKTCKELVEAKVKHQSNVLETNNMNITKVDSGYIMLPVFMVNINYKGKKYTFAMNGQTGKLVGNIPVGVKETIMWTIIIFLGFFLVISMIVYLV